MISALVSTRSLEIRDLDETVEKDEVVSAPSLALGRTTLDGSCRLFTRFGGVKAAVIRLAEADAARLLQLSKVRIERVECRIRKHVEFAKCIRCFGYGHGSRGCSNPDRKDACWRCGTTGHLARNCKAQPRCLVCSDRGDKDVAHVSGIGFCLVFRKEFRRLRGRNASSCSSTSEGGRMPRTS